MMREVVRIPNVRVACLPLVVSVMTMVLVTGPAGCNRHRGGYCWGWGWVGEHCLHVIEAAGSGAALFLTLIVCVYTCRSLFLASRLS